MKTILFLSTLVIIQSVFAQQPPVPAKPVVAAKTDTVQKTAQVGSADTTTKESAPVHKLDAATEALIAGHKPTNRFFMGLIDPFSIDLKSVPTCKKKIVDLCGASMHPRPGSFTACLQKNYDKIKSEMGCDLLTRGLIGSGFVTWLARTTENCDIYYKKCVVNLKSQLVAQSNAFDSCLATDPTVPPVCTKLVQDAVLNGYVISQIYDYLKTSW